MKNNSRRTPRDYDGTGATSRSVVDLLPVVLQHIGRIYEDRIDLVMEAWPEIIGPKLALMTEVSSFSSGVLTIKVKNSTLHSLLHQHDKHKILANLKKKFPNLQIKNVIFRIG